VRESLWKDLAKNFSCEPEEDSAIILRGGLRVS
jgi:hypothetical protein